MADPDPLTIVPTDDPGRRVGSISASNPVPGQTPVYIVGADGDIYIAQDDLGLIVETA